jgi:glycerophosphoryl diester phosphodiesterase
MKIYGHRGSPATHPENTLEGFAHALGAGADALELDVRQTRDGKVVVAHDADATRVTGVRRVIADCTYDEVSRWSVAWPDGASASRRGARVVMPLFEDVLTAFPGASLNVDLKAPGLALVRAVLAIVRRREACAQVRLASFSQQSLHFTRQQGYEGATGLGPMEVLALRMCPSWLSACVVRGSAVQVPVAQRGVRFDQESFVARAHQLGLLVHFWTINDVDEARRLGRLGADGIITDDPGRLSRALQRG